VARTLAGVETQRLLYASLVRSVQVAHCCAHAALVAQPRLAALRCSKRATLPLHTCEAADVVAFVREMRQLIRLAYSIDGTA
jgi:hypothetical protein